MDASIRSRSALYTVAIHAALFLILLFTLMTTTIPPFPEAGGGGGILVNIGTLDEASGDVQPMSETVTKAPAPEKVKAVTAHEAPVATQDNEAAPVAAEKKDVKKDIKPVKTEVKTITEVKKVVEPVKKVNPGALYQGKTTESKSQGTGQGKGDQGDPTGDPFSKYTGKNGHGTGGTGTGTGNEIGPGSTNGPPGISFSLAGRRMVNAPQISDRSQETGKVVVDITVDKDGLVSSAIPGGRGSTTTSAYLFRLAKEAALRAKFNAGAEGADIQKGSMTFVFLVQ